MAPTASGRQTSSRATIADVAKRAGVAVSTVSRALTNPERVSVATREKVQRVADELRYRPRTPAKAPASPMHRSVALLVPDITNPFYFALIRATQRQLRAAGYVQILMDTEASPDVEADVLARVQSMTRGVILGASRLSDDQLEELTQTVPVVAVNRSLPTKPCVLLDTPQCYGQVLEHLYSLGHRHIAYVGASGSWMSQQRRKAIWAKAKELDMKASEVNGFPPAFESGAAAADAFLRTNATACVAANDRLAVGIMERFGERGIRVPDDVSVVGCDDDEVARMSHPRLTTLSAPIEEAGRIATSMMVSLLEPDTAGALRNEVWLPTHLTVRGSTGEAPTGEHR